MIMCEGRRESKRELAKYKNFEQEYHAKPIQIRIRTHCSTQSGEYFRIECDDCYVNGIYSRVKNSFTDLKFRLTAVAIV